VPAAIRCASVTEQHCHLRVRVRVCVHSDHAATLQSDQYHIALVEHCTCVQLPSHCHVTTMPYRSSTDSADWWPLVIEPALQESKCSDAHTHIQYVVTRLPDELTLVSGSGSPRTYCNTQCSSSGTLSAVRVSIHQRHHQPQYSRKERCSSACFRGYTATVQSRQSRRESAVGKPLYCTLAQGPSGASQGCASVCE
jgi:hypothetical protein